MDKIKVIVLTSSGLKVPAFLCRMSGLIDMPENEVVHINGFPNSGYKVFYDVEDVPKEGVSDKSEAPGAIKKGRPRKSEQK